MIAPIHPDDKHIMRALRVCLFLFAASIAHPSLHAATRSTTRRLAATQTTFHRSNTVLLHHLSFPHHYPPALDLPAETAPSSVNPPSTSHGFSLISFAIHSVLSLFRHSTA